LCWQEAPGRKEGGPVGGGWQADKAAADGWACHVIVAIHVAASLHKHDLTLAFIFISAQRRSYFVIPYSPHLLVATCFAQCIWRGGCIIYAYACQMSHMPAKC